jgi:hypothetical protein
MPTPPGFLARGFSAASTISGTIVVRAQYEILLRWNGDHIGSNMISTGSTGTLRQVVMPNSVSMKRVKTLLLAAPPRERIASRARAICGASTESPIIFNAK